jgi:hypothetical protein
MTIQLRVMRGGGAGREDGEQAVGREGEDATVQAADGDSRSSSECGSLLVE